jgi:hypothetical protein
MKPTLGGASFVYRGIDQDYCFIECLECLATLCDEVAICYGGDDGTIEAVEKWAEDRKSIHLIKFTKEEWDEQKGREKLSYFSNKAIEALQTSHVFYLQADEILHEKSFPFVRAAIEVGDPAFLVTRFNLWASPATMLNVVQERKPCSSEVIRLAHTQYRCVDDAESLGLMKYASDKFIKEIKIFHVGFIRDGVKHLEKIRHIQDDVFLIDHDKRIDGMKTFDPFAFFSKEDLIAIPEPLPIFIQEWAKKRYPEL